MISNMYYTIFTNRLSIISLTVILLLILSSLFYTGKKITIKKNRIYRTKIFFPKLLSIILKFNFIRKERDRLIEDIALLTQKNKVTNTTYANNFLSIFAFFFIGIFALSILFIKYTVLKVFAPISIAVIVMLFLKLIVDSKRKTAQNDFQSVLKTFISYYVRSFVYIKTFQQCIDHIPDSHKYEFARIISSGDDFVPSLEEYKKRINTGACITFVEILKVGMIDNKQVLPALSDLQNKIIRESNNYLVKKNKLTDKIIGIFLGIGFCVLCVFINIYLLGDYGKVFFFQTFFGQLLIFITACYSIFTLIFIYISYKLI